MKVEVIDNLFIGGYKQDWGQLYREGVTVVVRLTRREPRYRWRGVLYRWPFDDVEELPDLGQLASATEFVRRQLVLGQGVLVHCELGLNRSALVIGETLKLLGMSGRTAVEIIRLARGPEALNNSIYERLVRGPVR